VLQNKRKGVSVGMARRQASAERACYVNEMKAGRVSRHLKRIRHAKAVVPQTGELLAMSPLCHGRRWHGEQEIRGAAGSGRC